MGQTAFSTYALQRISTVVSMKSFNWWKLGIITETGNSYFSHTAETLHFEAKNDSNINVVTYWQLKVNDRVRLVQNVSRITLISTSLNLNRALISGVTAGFTTACKKL